MTAQPQSYDSIRDITPDSYGDNTAANQRQPFILIK